MESKGNPEKTEADEKHKEDRENGNRERESNMRRQLVASLPICLPLPSSPFNLFPEPLLPIPPKVFSC
jgi:hypothetical protein